ncbi:MAG TPA: GRP family sugar transporter [bacterium]|nr:GRP family sugar transporter [bacterium]HPN43086.1 GRP family sugar transporter [bacterium]
MVIVQSYALAVFMCFITMLCWGSWGNTQKLASKEWRFQLFYWDYSLGVVLLMLLAGLTMGSIGIGGRSFLADLGQADSAAIVSAIIGGIIFNFANILLVAAIDIAGMAVAFPVGIGLALVIGVVDNYIRNPKGDPTILFVGVALVVIAIILDAIAYSKLPSGGKKNIVKGLVLSVLCGIAMGFFYGFIVKSMATNFETPEVGKMTPYTASFVFAIGLFISNFVWNTIVMYKPFSGASVTYKDYFIKGNMKLHWIGILGGAIWAIGNLFSLIASEKAGPAISYGLGQGATMVAAFWGVFIWKEFKSAPKGTNTLISLMFLLFIIGLAIIIIARIV